MLYRIPTPVRIPSPEENTKKINTSDHSGFAGVRLPKINAPPASIRSPELGSSAQVCLPASDPLPGADDFFRLRVLSPGEIIQNDHHIRPRRLRRSSAARHASSSG